MSQPILPIYIWRCLFSLAHTPFFPTCHTPSFLYTSGGVFFLSLTPHFSPHVTPHSSYIHLEVSFSLTHTPLFPTCHTPFFLYLTGCLFLEVAHIMHANHSASFYQLMEELTQQHECLIKRGVVLDKHNMPIGVPGHVLDPTRHNPTMPHARDSRGSAAAARLASGRLMGSGRVGGAGEGEGSSTRRGGHHSWKSQPPFAMALEAAERRLREWDLSNGLAADELEMAAASQELEAGSENEVEEVLPPEGGEQAAPRNPSAGTSTIRWGAKGGGTWQRVPCPVCGPVCDAAKHGPDGPPPQDADEGSERMAGGKGTAAVAARRDTAAVAARRDTAAVAGRGTAAVAGRGTAAVAGKATTFVDLTCSSDEEVSSVPPTKRGRQQGGGARRTPRSSGTALVVGASWRCTRCTLLNEAASKSCEACLANRPDLAAASVAGEGALIGGVPVSSGCSAAAAGSIPYGFWSCWRCTCLNPKGTSDERCQGCGIWRFAR